MGKRRLLILLLGLLLLSLGIALDPKGIRHTLHLAEDAERLRRENAELRSANERLKTQLRHLAGQPDALERVAREELGLVLPDEIIFQLETEDVRSP